MDISQAYGKYFINIAAVGTLTELTYSVPSEVKSRLGYLAYVAEGAKCCLAPNPVRYGLSMIMVFLRARFRLSL